MRRPGPGPPPYWGGSHSINDSDVQDNWGLGDTCSIMVNT